MVNSLNGLFQAFLINPSNREPLSEINGTDNYTYVIGENGGSFQIQLQSCKRGEIYGCSLHIDGKLICKAKTFKGKGHFFGFQTNEGSYRVFKFIIPPLTEVGTRHPSIINAITQNGGKIRVDLFGVKKVNYVRNQEKMVRKTGMKSDNPDFLYQPTESFIDKKVGSTPLTIDRGDIYHHNKKFDEVSKLKNNLLEKIDLQVHLDVCEFKYSDFASLILQNHLSIYNKDHLRFIPLSFFNSNAYLVERMLRTILQTHRQKRLSQRNLGEEVKRYTGHRFDDLGGGRLRHFLMGRKEVFLFDGETDEVGLVESEGFKPMRETLEDLKPGNLFDRSYFENVGEKMVVLGKRRREEEGGRREEEEGGGRREEEGRRRERGGRRREEGGRREGGWRKEDGRRREEGGGQRRMGGGGLREEGELIRKEEGRRRENQGNRKEQGIKGRKEGEMFQEYELFFGKAIQITD